VGGNIREEQKIRIEEQWGPVLQRKRETAGLKRVATRTTDKGQGTKKEKKSGTPLTGLSKESGHDASNRATLIERPPGRKDGLKREKEAIVFQVP